MSVNLTTKYSSLIAERFKGQSITDAYAGKKYDFDGAQSIKIYTVDKVALGDYSRTANGGRFGTVAELGDTVQTLTMSQDKAFTFSIDHGNAEDQFNIKHCNEQLKSNWDEVCTPAIDIYRLTKWANGAGLGLLNSTARTSATVMRSIMLASATMNNKLVPKKNRVLLIAESIYIESKLSSEIMGIETLGEAAIKNGVVGRIDGMDVVPVVDSYLPAGVNFIIKYKDATVDPMKLITGTVRDDEYQQWCFDNGYSSAKTPSFHSSKAGLAFDVCKNKKGEEYSDADFWRVASAIGKTIGFTWGGDWTRFTDKPHFQWDDHGKYTGTMIRTGSYPVLMPRYAASRTAYNEEDDDMARITDAEFAAYMKRYLSVAGTGDAPSDWAKDATQAMKDAGIISGDGQGNYGWQKPITREAVAQILYNRDR